MARKPPKRTPPKAKPSQKRTTTKRVQASENAPFRPPPTVEHRPEIDDDEQCGEDGLNIRRRAFVDHLTGDAMGNATRAAELAGYRADNRNSLHQTASRLLTFVKVQEAIAKALAARRLTADYTRAAVADLASATMASFLSVGPDGEPMFDWHKAAANGAIGHVREYQEEGVKDGERFTAVKRKFKLHDRLRALELLAKMQGLVKADAPEQADPPRARLRPIRRPDDADAATN